MSAAMKLVVNSAYGYLAAGGGLTRFADVHAANEVTRRGRETLDLMCRELAARGVTLLEADTDGVYFAVPEGWNEADERRVVAEVAALLPPLVQLEFEGRYAAMLSHEPKNYALLGYDGALLLRGVAFRSSRAEPFGEAFLRRAIAPAARGRRRRRARRLPRHAGCAAPARAADLRRVVPRAADQDAGRSTSRPATPGASCRTRRCSRAAATSWSVGDRVRVYRTQVGRRRRDRRVRGRSRSTERGSPRLRRRALCARAARDVRRAARARVHARRLRRRLRRPGPASLFTPPVETIRTVLNSLPESGLTAPGRT